MGIGGGAGIGGSAQPPTIRETETTAFVEVNKQALGIIPQGEVLPFTDIDKESIYKYKANPETPTLDHSLLMLRSSESHELESDATLGPAYDQLVSTLPETVQGWLKSEMEKPFEERDPQFVIFNNALQLTAKSPLWLAEARSTPAENTPEARHNALNAALPFIALTGAIAHAAETLADSRASIDGVGRNNPNYDDLVNRLNELESSLVKMDALKGEIKDGEISKATIQNMKKLAFKIATQLSHSHDVGASSDLKIVETQLSALELTAKAWSIHNGSPTLLIGTSIATTGLSTDESALGTIGKGMNHAINSALDGILGSHLQGARAEIKEMESLHESLSSLMGQEEA